MELNISLPNDLFTYRPVAFFNDTALGSPTSSHPFSGRERLDLNLHCIKRPDDTFFMRITGSGMTNTGIRSGDILVVDRILLPKLGDLVVIMQQGEMVVYEMQQSRDSCSDEACLLSLNPDHPNLDTHATLHIVGIVTSIIHHIRQ
ncbi:MAG: LexA family protein [Plesiomonas sp.]|uniref:LexA family protein n=1 Tax=Plesiomonas sp. TaxID=2486279 RepID=UPI003F3CE955